MSFITALGCDVEIKSRKSAVGAGAAEAGDILAR